MRTKKLILAAAAVSAFASSGSALAMQAASINRDAMLEPTSMAVTDAKLPISSAIAEAEKDTGGSAVDALLMSRGEKPVYLISLQDPTDRGIVDVLVNAENGQVYGNPAPMMVRNFEPSDSGV
ncbi:MAG: PepSY domain-containing protein [Burkholderiales bacterium]|jgi:uncharacterized membrane protein YkoI